jgi:hypothetical protein
LILAAHVLNVGTALMIGYDQNAMAQKVCLVEDEIMVIIVEGGFVLPET